MEKTVRKSFNGRNLQQMTRVTKGLWNLQQMGKVTRLFCWHQDFVHYVLSAPAPGPYTCGKKCIKSEFKAICLKLATNGRSNKGFLLTSKVCPQGVFCPCPGAIYMYNIINVYKIRFRRNHLKLATYGQREKAFLLPSKVCPQWIFCPCRGYIHMVKHEKNVYKVRL